MTSSAVSSALRDRAFQSLCLVSDHNDDDESSLDYELEYKRLFDNVSRNNNNVFPFEVKAISRCCGNPLLMRQNCMLTHVFKAKVILYSSYSVEKHLDELLRFLIVGAFAKTAQPMDFCGISFKCAEFGGDCIEVPRCMKLRLTPKFVLHHLGQLAFRFPNDFIVYFCVKSALASTSLFCSCNDV